MSRTDLARMTPLTLFVAISQFGPRASALSAQVPTPSTRVTRALSANVYRAHLDYLSDDLLEGRAPATRGGELAAKYVAAQFQRLGLEPAGDSGSYFHRVPIIALTPDPLSRSLAPTRPRYAIATTMSSGRCGTRNR